MTVFKSFIDTKPLAKLQLLIIDCRAVASAALKNIYETERVQNCIFGIFRGVNTDDDAKPIKVKG